MQEKQYQKAANSKEMSITKWCAGAEVQNNGGDSQNHVERETTFKYFLGLAKGNTIFL